MVNSLSSGWKCLCAVMCIGICGTGHVASSDSTVISHVWKNGVHIMEENSSQGVDAACSRDSVSGMERFERENSKICFIAGPMRAGKSKMLIDFIFNGGGEGKSNILAFTSSLVVTDGAKPCLHTRADGRTVHANIFDNTTDFIDAFQLLKKCVASTQNDVSDFSLYIDEGQFLTEDQLKQLARVSMFAEVKEVNISGLIYNYMGEMFLSSKMLLDRYAAFVLRENANCELCGAKSAATKNIRLDGNGRRMLRGDEISIGNDQYKSVCDKCFDDGLR